MGRLFGTDGVRGVANTELTPTLAMQLGQAGAYVLTKENEHKPTILVGCDTRISGGMLANALMQESVLWAPTQFISVCCRLRLWHT